MQLRARNRNTSPMIGLTPLIDVVFILLVFFMLASSFMDWRGFDMAVTVSKGTATTRSQTGPVTINVGPDGDLRLGGEQIALVALAPRILRDHPGVAVHLRPVNGASLQGLITVMDALGRGGIANVDLIE